MGRRKNEPELWHIIADKETKELIIFHPSAQPEYTTSEAKKKYTHIGALTAKEDAEMLCQYKESGLKPDAIAFLQCEHTLRNTKVEEESKTADDIQTLVEAVRQGTGRLCFGKCKSMEESPACAECYRSLRHTWVLCASVKCLVGSNEEPKSIFDEIDITGQSVEAIGQ